MKQHRKRLIKLGLLIGLCLTFISSSAYFVTRIQTNNVVSFGNIKVELINNTFDENGNEVQANNEEDLLKNKSLSRIVKVRNISDHPAYVRIKFDMQGKEESNTYPASDYVEYVLGDEAWQEKDGWFYYVKALNPNTTTTNLMEGLKFDTNKLTSDHPGSEICWTIKVQAVQSENNADNVFLANGWSQEGVENE